MKTTYERPVEAELVVRLRNGETWPAKSDDLKKFGLVDRYEVYGEFADRLRRILAEHGPLREDQDLTDSELNPLRYLVELVIHYPDLIDHPDHDDLRADIGLIANILHENRERIEAAEEARQHD